MQMQIVKEKARRLVRKYNTNNPFKIAQEKGIIVRHVELGSVLGFHVRHFRCSIIHINERSTEQEQLFTCAHELGHAVLHPNENTPFLKSNTYFSTDRIEVEANTFAIELLFSQTVDSVTIHEATEKYGAPKQILYKKFYT